MKYSIMITSLFGGKARPELDYYYTEDSERTQYCNALLAAEASSKYILAKHHIDEIITLGSKSTYDPGDEMKQMVLRERSSFYSSDVNSLSTYSLLRYRLAQYIDEIRIEEQDTRELLSEEDQRRVKDFCRAFYRDHIQPDGNTKFNRTLDALRRDIELRTLFLDEFVRAMPEVADAPDRYKQWTLNYLYDEMKDSAKLELLEGNEDVKIRFIPTGKMGSLSVADKLAGEFNMLVSNSGGELDIELYICILSEDASDSFALMNLMEIFKTLSNSHIKIKKIATALPLADEFANSITDDTELYSISDLIAGTRSFLKYGKTDLLMDYWKKQGTENLYIERLLYAMRNIDVGISLCDINDIERGINSLRNIFAEGDFVPGDDLVERYFDIIIDGIKADYGVLVTGDTINFIDLVKWSYRKGFWQQTLTLIESRAPRDFVNRGIYYYLGSEDDRDKVVRILGQVYYDLRIFEKYKLDDVSHYFIKFYGRARTDRAGLSGDGIPVQRAYAALRSSDMDVEDDDIIKAQTLCPDREAVSNLLFAYYVAGHVRNTTNHAEDEEDTFERRETDVSERMNLIRQTIENFISKYDQVLALMPEQDPEIPKVSNAEIRAYAQTLKPRYGRSYDGNRRGGYQDNRQHDSNKQKQDDKQPERDGSKPEEDSEIKQSSDQINLNNEQSERINADNAQSQNNDQNNQ